MDILCDCDIFKLLNFIKGKLQKRKKISYDINVKIILLERLTFNQNMNVCDYMINNNYIQIFFYF